MFWVNPWVSVPGTISLQPTSNSSSQFSHQLQIALREAEVRENQLRQLVDKADKEKLELDRQLEEERRKVEDLHFRLETSLSNTCVLCILCCPLDDSLLFVLCLFDACLARKRFGSNLKSLSFQIFGL